MKTKIRKTTDTKTAETAPERVDPRTELARRDLHPLEALRGEIDRLFDQSFAGWPFGRSLTAFDPFRRLGAPFAVFGDMTPSVDLAETDKGYEVTAELPGIEEKDVSVEIADGVLSIKGEKHDAREDGDGGYHLSERRFGSFHRCFRLPEKVDEAAVEASFKNGVLTVVLPKAEPEAARTRKIEVKTS